MILTFQFLFKIKRYFLSLDRKVYSSLDTYMYMYIWSANFKDNITNQSDFRIHRKCIGQRHGWTPQMMETLLFHSPHCLKITRTLTKSERAPPKVCHYDSYLLVSTLNFDRWPSNVIISPSCIFVWNMKSVCQNLLTLSCQNQTGDKFKIITWPLTFWPQNV